MLLGPSLILPGAGNFFSPIADRINMLPWMGTTGYAGTQGNGAWSDPFITGPDYAFAPSGAGSPNWNGWTVTRGSVSGGFLAPDGTTTAQKLIADASNNTHFTQSGITAAANFTPTGLISRIAFFAKAAEYRRICLQLILDGAFPSNSISFDLVSREHSPIVTSGSTPVAFNPAIAYFGNGWCRCSLDFDLSTSISQFPTFLLDNGTGTAAVSTSFAGDGSSGVLLWRANMLPTAAWNMSSRVFFDDFTSIGTIDVNDTGAAGYNWYTHMAWPNQTPDLTWRAFPTTPPSSISVSNSYLTLINAAVNIQLATARTNGASGPGAYIGTVFSLPMMTEIKCNVDPTVSNGASTWPAFWRWSVEGNTGEAPSRTSESDEVEYRPNVISNPQSNLHSWTNLSTHVDRLNGYPAQDGAGFPHPLWAVDHRFNVLQITQAANGGVFGIRMTFIDGMFVNSQSIVYSSTTDPYGLGETGAFSQGDSQHFMLNLTGTHPGAGSGYNVDYVSVYK